MLYEEWKACLYSGLRSLHPHPPGSHSALRCLAAPICSAHPQKEPRSAACRVNWVKGEAAWSSDSHGVCREGNHASLQEGPALAPQAR